MSTLLERLKERNEKVIMNTYARYPLGVSRGKGTRLYDLEGREYVDLLAGIAVNALGYSHPEITQAIREQADKLIHVSNLFYQEEQTALAETLLTTCDNGQVFFCNSGAEANEGAIKLARRYQHRILNKSAFEVITFSGSFHGRTLATLTATGQDKIKDGFDPLPAGFKIIPWGDLEVLQSAIGDNTAAILTEVIQGEGGINIMSQEYALAMERICREKGILLIIDEIQTGLGRTGRFWGFQNYGLKPDIFTSAKALAAGLPMGAIVATPEVAKAFGPGSHATTFGGGPLVSAAARAFLKVLIRDNLSERAAVLGQIAKEIFLATKERFPEKISDVRGLGLLIGIELTFPGKDVWKALLDKGFIINLTQDKILRLLPPLIIEEQDLMNFAAALEEVLQN